MEIGKFFAAWILERINQFQFVEEQDFIVISNFGKNPQGGRPTIDYIISLDMAKELAMIERNEKGKIIRQYFIEIEKQFFKQQKELSRIDILKMALDSEEKRIEAEAKLLEAKPKAEFYDSFVETNKLYSFEEAAKLLAEKYKIGRTRLFDFCRQEKLLESNSTRPYQRHIEAGLFKIKIKQSNLNMYCVPFFTQKGLLKIEQLLERGNYAN